MIWVIDKVIHWHELDKAKHWTSAITFATGVQLESVMLMAYSILKLYRNLQNRMTEVWRDLWRSFSQILCSRRDTYSLSSTMSRHILNISKEGDPTISQSNCASVWSPSKLKSISWYSEENSCVYLCILLLVLLLSTIQLKSWTEKKMRFVEKSKFEYF